MTISGWEYSTLTNLVKHCLAYRSLWVWFSKEGKERWREMCEWTQEQKVSRMRNWRCRTVIVKVTFLLYLFSIELWKQSPMHPVALNDRICPLTALEATSPATPSVRWQPCLCSFWWPRSFWWLPCFFWPLAFASNPWLPRVQALISASIFLWDFFSPLVCFCPFLFS